MDVIQGIHRVSICVENIEEARKAFEEKLGCEFFDPGVYEPLKVHSITDVDRGIVLTGPTAEDSILAEPLRQRGQHVVSICFRVSDLEEAKRLCEERGIDILQEIRLTPEQSERYTDAAEIILDPACFPEWGGNFMMFYGKE